MDNKQWDALGTQVRQKLLRSAGLSFALAQLRYSSLSKAQRSKLDKQGKGWFEGKKPIKTRKGIEHKAPKHHKVAIRKEAGKALNTPMERKEEKAISDELTKKESPEEMLIQKGADLKGVDIDRLEDFISSKNPEPIKKYKLKLTKGAFAGKSAYRCPEDNRALYVWEAGEGTEHLHLACDSGHATTFDKAINLRKIGKDKETTEWAKKQYEGWLAEAKTEGYPTIEAYVNSMEDKAKDSYKEYAKLGIGLEKIFSKRVSKEPPLISDPQRKSYDQKFEESEAERTRAEEEREREWNIQEAEEYIGAQGVNPITGESMGRDWDNVVRESWIESEAHNDEFNELATEVMLSGATNEDYDAWKAKFIADPQGTIQKLKGLISKNAVKTKDWQEIEKEADEYIENTCNIKGVRYPKTECRRMLIAVSSGWKSGGVMLKREAQDEAKKFRAQGFRVRVEKVI